MKKPTFLFISETFPDWLKLHPDLQPWTEGRLCLERETNAFIEQCSPLFYDSTKRTPRTSELWKWLFSGWVYHWEKRDIRWTLEESREYLFQGMEFQPLKEIVFSEAIYDRQNAAAVHFQINIAPYLYIIGERLLNIMDFSGDPNDEWLNEFWIFLLDEPEGRPCVILRYMGLVPIRNWLALVFTNHVNNQWRNRKGYQKPFSLEEISDQEGPQRSSQQDDERFERLFAFLSEFLKKATARLDAESRMRLEYTYLEELSNREVASILRETSSQTSRKRLAIEECLVRELREELRQSEEWQDVEELFSQRSASDLMKTMLGGKP